MFDLISAHAYAMERNQDFDSEFFLNAYIVFEMNVVHLNLQQDLIDFVWTKEPDNIPIGHSIGISQSWPQQGYNALRLSSHFIFTILEAKRHKFKNF